MKRSCSVALLLLESCGVACGSVEPLGRARPRQESPLEPGTGSPPEPGEALDEMAPASAADALEDAAWQASDEPLYVVTTRISTASGVHHSFLLTVPGIGPGARFDLERAIQLDGESPAFGARGRPFAYSAAEAEPSLLRWRVLADGSLRQQDSISFASIGLRRADAAASLAFLAADKAYFCNRFDPSEIVIWNPETLQIRGTIPLELPAQSQMLPQVVLSQRGDRLFAVVSWQQAFSTDWTHFGDHVQLITIDTVTDQVLARVNEPRCNLLSAASQGADGTAYFSPASYYAPLRSMLGENSGVEGCALRIPRGDERFEPDYALDLAALAGGRPAGDLALVSDGTAFLRVWHSELVTPLAPDHSNWEQVIGEAGFLWWTWQVGAEQAEPVADQQPSKDALVFVVDDKTYTATPSDDGATSALDELGADGVLHRALSGPGQIYGVFRVR